ncbi:MAG: cytochrome d ubiquinol oxidase subunit II [Chloroflexota bacterium]|nr:cytochrome d ubiquinol oxidase subunit II [Chloroflexota bacterium]
MDLNTLWFVLIAVLYIGFFILEGFDFGVGILLPFMGKAGGGASADTMRRTMINTIGPHWDGNEVWLLAAGGATFAAFPLWYATMFSGFYLPFFFLLIMLIIRGVAFEFRSKDDNPKWRALWDGCMFLGSLLAPFFLGVAFANLVRGVPIDNQMLYAGGFFYLLNPYALLGGVTVVMVCVLHGAIFLSMKTTGNLMDNARKALPGLWVVSVVLAVTFLTATYFSTGISDKPGILAWIVPIASAIALLAAGYFIRRKREGWAFGMTALTLALVVVMFFVILYPNVMISTGPGPSLTIYNASSAPYTLKVLTIVAVILLPIIMAYQAWTYWVFRKRIETKPDTLTY